MKLIIVVLALAAAALAEESIILDYHHEIGIPLAAKIKAYESRLLRVFDGSRITGGNPSNLGTHPHLAGLVITLTTGQISVCGASVLSNTRAVTAAQCWSTNNSQAAQFTVVLGSTLLFFDGIRINTNSVELHPNYNPSTINNAIAIISFNWVNYNNAIQPVALPTFEANNHFVGSWAWAVGYGLTGDNHFIENLQVQSEVSLQVIENTVCSQIYGSSVDPSTTICASGSNQKSTCPGDTGGPLWLWSGHNRTLIGISSLFHSGGCQSGYPTGYVRISNYVSWIQARL